jgi:serine/threonine-protein phosphatase 2A activator
MYLADQTPIVEDPNQRFGNKAFRTYIQRTTDYLSPSTSSSASELDLDTKAELSRTFLSSCPGEIKSDVLDLWIGGNAWGHETRLDYGTGHELAFVLGLWVLVKRGWLGAEAGADRDEDDLILRVFPRWVQTSRILLFELRPTETDSHDLGI